jgi:hypothetical protein
MSPAKKTTKKENAMKKVVAKEAVEGEMNMHGVRVKGLTSWKSTDGQAGGTSSKVMRVGKLSAQKSTKKGSNMTFDIKDITGKIPSSESIEAEDVSLSPDEEYSHGSHEDQSSISPIESPHVIGQGILDPNISNVAEEENLEIMNEDVASGKNSDVKVETTENIEKDFDNLESLLDTNDPLSAEDIESVLGLSQVAVDQNDEVSVEPTTSTVEKDDLPLFEHVVETEKVGEGRRREAHVGLVPGKKSSKNKKVVSKDDVVLSSLLAKNKKTSEKGKEK